MEYIVTSDSFTKISETAGTLQNLDKENEIEMSENPVFDSGLRVKTGEKLNFSNTDIYLRCVKDGGTAVVRVVPFSVNAKGGDDFSVDTTALKSVTLVGNALNFYTSSDTAQAAAYSIDIPAEQFLDQAATSFVPNFYFSAILYPDAINPNLNGKPVFVLGVKTKSNDGLSNTVKYSFIDVSKLVDTYVESDTSVTVSDYKIKVNISPDAGNALKLKANGLYADGVTDTATSSALGLTKLYNTTGANTDGTLTQAAITTELAGKLDSDATAAAAFKDSAGNVITDTYATKTELAAASDTYATKTALAAKLDSDAKAVSATTADELKNAQNFITNLNSTSAGSFNGTASVSAGVTGTLPVANGGTGQSNLDNVTVGKAKSLNSAQNFITNLNSTSAASFNGTASVSAGVTGTLPVANGGTGQSNLDNVTVGKATKAIQDSSGNVITDTYVTKTETQNFVVKDGSKVLSTNDFTTAEKNKLANIDTNAQVNVIESVKVNNSALAVSNKSVNIDLSNYATSAKVNSKLDSDATAVSATTADKLSNARSLKVSLSSTSAPTFDGSANVTTIGVGGILPTTYGGTGNANGTVSGAAQLNTSRNFITNLNSTSAGSFNGTASVSAGVTGTLPVANGGTGQSNLDNVVVGKATKAIQDSAGNVITDTYVTKSELSHKLAAVRYGYRIKKDEADPDLRVEYLYDAAGMRPAHMVFDTDTSTAGTDSDTSYFDYGDWQSVWFVRDNKPCMLNPDGTVAYFLDPNDYSKKADGTVSDVADSDTDLNAMAQFPLAWIKRYEDDNYLYEIVSNVQYDETYKAYAHTCADGSIADFFYRSIYGGSGSSSKIRSLSEQSLIHTMTIANMFTGAQANGSGWHIDSWSRWELIRTLFLLMFKTCKIVDVLGKADKNYQMKTGILNQKGQFWGCNKFSCGIKIFHMESAIGRQQKRCAGLTGYNGRAYVKMTNEGSGYRPNDINGYTNSGVSWEYISYGFISSMKCGYFGMITSGKQKGSSSTYFCTETWLTNFNKYCPVCVGFDNVFAGTICLDTDSKRTSEGCALTFA